MSSNYQRTDTDISFEIVKEPKLNYYYHLSWGYKGARFCLTEIDPGGINGVIWTGKTKNKYIKIKLADLRHIRNRKDKF